MAQSRTADVPVGGNAQTIDSTSSGRAERSEGGTPITSYIGLGIAAMLLIAMMVVGSIWV